MSGTTAGISITSSQISIPAMPIELVIPPPQSRVVKEGWVYKRGIHEIHVYYVMYYIIHNIDVNCIQL